MFIKHIHLIAPSYSVSEQSIKLTKTYFENLGMEVTVPPDLLGEDLLCANKDEIRLAHLKAALNDTSADAIWLLQGGYGLTRIIHELFHMEKPKKEKLFIGCSDGTALHVFLNQVWNWPTLHGPGASTIAKQKVSPQTIEAVLHIARQSLSSYTPPTLKPFNRKAREVTSLFGTLIGGNLCLLQCGIGTNWQLDSSGKILFFEDVDERGYRVDRMLVHLQQAGILEKAKAIIFGDFVGGKEADGSSLIMPVLKKFADSINLPVFSLPGCGHGDENFPLLFNRELEFRVSFSAH